MKKECRSASREISMAGICLQVGDQEFDQALKSKEEYLLNEMIHILAAYSMWMFGLEATTNVLLSRLWSKKPELFVENETTLEEVYWFPIKDKIKKFFELSGENAPDFRGKPFQTACILKKVRDSMVHGKASVTEGLAVIDSAGRPEFSKSQIPIWQRECNIDYAKKYKKDIQIIIGAMCGLNNGSLGNPSEILEVVFVDSSPINKI